MSTTTTPTRGTSRIRSYAWSAARLILVVAVFVVMFATGALDPAQLRDGLSRPLPLVAGALLLLASWLVSVLRWQTLLAVQDIRVRWWDATRLTLIGLFFSTVIPGAVSGDVVKAYYVVRGRPRKTDAIMTILLDRILGMYTMVLLAIVVIVLGWTTTMAGAEQELRADPRVRAVAVSMCVIFAGMTAGLLAATNGRLRSSKLVGWLLARAPFRETVQRLYDAVHVYGRHPRRTALALVYSILAQMPLFAGLYCMARAAGVEGIPAGVYCFIFPVGLIVNALPVLPAGLGQGEAAFEWLFGLFGSDGGGEVALFFHAAMILFAVGLGGLAYLLGRRDLDIRFGGTGESRDR